MSVPNEVTQFELKKVGVVIMSTKVLTLKCRRCEEVWEVHRKGLRLPKGYWRCPNGCNRESGKDRKTLLAEDEEKDVTTGIGEKFHH